MEWCVVGDVVGWSGVALIAGREWCEAMFLGVVVVWSVVMEWCSGVLYWRLVALTARHTS